MGATTTRHQSTTLAPLVRAGFQIGWHLLKCTVCTSSNYRRDFIGLSHAGLCPDINRSRRGSCKLIYGNVERPRGQMFVHTVYDAWIPVCNAGESSPKGTRGNFVSAYGKWYMVALDATGTVWWIGREAQKIVDRAYPPSTLPMCVCLCVCVCLSRARGARSAGKFNRT